MTAFAATPFHIRRYDHDGLLLNLSGTRDADECVIARITVDGSAQNLIDIFPVNTLLSMAEKVDAQLSREARQQNAEARAERHQWDLEFRLCA